MTTHQNPKLTLDLLKQIESFLSNMDDNKKLELFSKVLEKMEDFCCGRGRPCYSHCPIPASIEERRVVGGQLQFFEDGKQVDCTKTQGRKIIPDIANVNVEDIKSSTAKFILVVQRYEVYRRMAVPRANESAEIFYERHPCIVVNVEEELDTKTKLFLCELRKELKIPILANVDSSPEGVKIISTVSKCCGYNVGWLGMTPTQLEKGRFAIPNDPRIRVPMTDNDLMILDDLMENDEFVKEKMRDQTWFEDLTLMKKTKTKTKVEDFDDFMSMLHSYGLIEIISN